MTPDLLHILQHSLGLDEHGLSKGEREGYRNHYVAGGDNISRCRDLVALGLMRETRASALTGEMPCFVVTDAGRDAVREHSPPAPKLAQTSSMVRPDIRSASSTASRTLCSLASMSVM